MALPASGGLELDDLWRPFQPRPFYNLYACKIYFYCLFFVYVARRNKTTMKREAFLQAVSKKSVEDFLRFTQISVSKP